MTATGSHPNSQIATKMASVVPARRDQRTDTDCPRDKTAMSTRGTITAGMIAHQSGLAEIHRPAIASSALKSVAIGIRPQPICR
jgi:hypothetical protein